MYDRCGCAAELHARQMIMISQCADYLQSTTPCGLRKLQRTALTLARYLSHNVDVFSYVIPHLESNVG
jgi:hypothetical protein